MNHDLLHDVAALAAPAPDARLAAGRRLAKRFGADDLIIFVRDEELGVLLPALGFPKTMPEGRAWQAFLADAPGTPNIARELVCPYSGARKVARAIACDGAVAVLLSQLGVEAQAHAYAGADEHEALRALLPLVSSLFSAERARAAELARQEIARQSAQRAEALAANLAVSQADLHRALRELHDSREWFSTTLRSIGDAVIVTDAEARITFMNGVAESLTRWSADEAQGHPLHEVFAIVNEATRAVVPSPVEEALRDGVVVALANHTVLLRRDGTEIGIDDSAAPIRNANGVIAGAVLIFRDITERRAAEKTRAQVVEELQRVVRGNELFAAILGHDLRNPLGAIIMSAELLFRTTSDARTKKTIERVLRSGARMQRMINQLLDFTRVRHGVGMVVSCKDDLDLVDLAEQVVAELAVAHPDWKITVDARGDLHGCFDPDRLSQVLSNLVGNAIQHGLPSGGVQVRLATEGADTVLIDVHNQGAIAGDVLPHVFDPFRSGRGSREQAAEGLGLGLFITKEIVRAHGGDIEVVSTPSLGTRFRIRLPRRPPKADVR